MKFYTAKIKSLTSLNNFLFEVNKTSLSVKLFDTEVLSSYSLKLMQTIAMASTWNPSSTFNICDYSYFTQSYCVEDSIARNIEMVFITDINSNKLIISLIKDKSDRVLESVFSFVGKREDDFHHYVKRLNIDKKSITFTELTLEQETTAMNLQKTANTISVKDSVEHSEEALEVEDNKEWKNFTMHFNKNESNYGNYNDCVQLISDFISENPSLLGTAVDYNYFSNPNETILEVHLIDTEFTEYLYCKIMNASDTVSITYKTNNYYTSILTNLIEYIEDL